MESLFSALYYGNYTAGVEAKVHDTEYQPILDTYARQDEAFKSLLSDELLEQYSRLNELNGEMQLMEQTDAYEFGLSQGLLMMAEAMRYNF